MEYETDSKTDMAHVVKMRKQIWPEGSCLTKKPSQRDSFLHHGNLFERSFETEEHAQRIGQLCAIIGERLGLSHDDIDKLRLFAILHDIGKIGVSDQILNKPAALTDEEWL